MSTLEELRAELTRVEAERSRAFDDWQAACTAAGKSWEKLRREEVRQEILREQAGKEIAP